MTKTGDGPGVSHLALECALVFLIMLVPLQSLLDASIFTVYQARDIGRASLLAAGHLILFGPESSGGGHLPGSFYYFFMALPLKLGFGWRSLWELQMIMMAASVSALWLFTRRRFGIFPACYALLCAAYSDFRTMLYGYNASFLPLFVVAALIALCRSFDESSERRSLSWALFCLFCGLGAQLHTTMLPLLLSGMVLQAAAPRLGLRPLAAEGFAAGLGVVLLTLLPYSVWLAAKKLGHPIGQTALSFTQNVPSNLMSSMFMYGAQKIRYMSARDLLRYGMLVIPFEAVFPLLFFKIGALGEKAAMPDAALRPERDRFAASCVTVLSTASLASVPPYLLALARSPTRYTIVPRLSLDLLICAVLARRAGTLRPASYYPALIGALVAFTAAWHIVLWPAGRAPLHAVHFLFPLLAGGSLAFLVSRGTSVPVGRALLPVALALPMAVTMAIDGYAHDVDWKYSPAIADYEAMSRTVHAQTGWTYEEAKRRIFYVNTAWSVTPSYIYRSVEREQNAAPPLGAAGVDRIDGYFAMLALGRPGAAEAKRLLLNREIAGTPAAGLAAGAILLGTPVACGRFFVIPYEVKDAERFPLYFHNGSEVYSPDGPTPKKIETGSIRFLFNDCPDHPDWCDVFADVRIGPAERGKRLVEVVLGGETISRSNEGTFSGRIQSLGRPYFTVACGGAERSVVLAESLGTIPDPNAPQIMNLSLLAPYERSFHVDCAGPIGDASVGYESATAYVYSTGKQTGLPLPGRRLFARRDSLPR